ncbi:hypothetical protein AB6A40_011085 [Gnathostoma spinigerum]|uniref:NTR domain-containing protein n=1 Tax=Gnathostoma spinigerum TaxID=75299 RepID=A0ABD6EYE5_9BILA
MKLTALFIFVGFLDVALSCQCLAEDLSSEEVVKRIFCEVETVAVVRVLKADRPTAFFGKTTYKVRLAKIYKAPEGKKDKDLYSFRSPAPSLCGVELKENERYLVAIRNSGGEPSLEICDQFIREGKPELQKVTLDLKRKLNKLKKSKCE